MRASKVETIIQDVICQKTKCKSVLIDGDWGCGKTTAIKQAIKNISENYKKGEKRIYYQSLYGVKEVSELTACYSKIGKIIYSVGKSVATPFTSLIPIVGNQISESLDNATALFELEAKQKKNRVFIFDDLERTDPSLSYVSLLGFFNQLLLRGCIIICVSSLNDFKKNNNSDKRKELETFIEKAFDRIFFINESPTEAIIEIFKSLNLSLTSLNVCEPMFENNLRLAIKTHRLLSDIKTHSSEYKYAIDKKFSEIQILKAAICSIRSIYLGCCQTNEEETKNDTPKLKKLEIGVPYNLSERRVKISLNAEIKKNADFYDFVGENFEVQELSRCFCWADVYDDYSELQKSYPSSVYEEKKSVDYNGSIFYLSDSDKKNQFIHFKDSCLKNEISIDRVFADQLMDIIRFGDFDITEDGLEDLIVEMISSEVLKGNEDAFRRMEDYIAVIRTEKNGDVIKRIIEKCRTKILEKQIEQMNKEILKISLNKNYIELSELLTKIKKNKESPKLVSEFKKHLINQDFFLPDLSETINYSIWSYCHDIAKFSSNDDQLLNNFLSTLKRLSDEYSNSPTAIDRIKALVEYNFPSETYDNFCEQIKNKN